MGTDRDVAWVIERFRPLLDKININDIPEEPKYQTMFLKDSDKFIQMGLEDCVFSICRRNFISAMNGYYTFGHKEYEKKNIFFMNINVNNILFASNTPGLREKRRRTIIHEFTHCIAAFLSIGRIRSEGLVSKLVDDLALRVEINKMDHYQQMLNQFGNASSTVQYALGIYPDEHFRLGYEDFEHSFSNVYKQLILDRPIFERYFIEGLRNEFYRQVKKGNIEEALKILGAVSAKLISKEAISAEFVNLRLREEFLGYYFKKAHEQ